ncbi:MAG TPA: hypothetical protein VMU37_03625, partial [Caulobacteraceae bacterium]|nr:hypothetical protein [Caulobacteraceae bacterium]
MDRSRGRSGILIAGLAVATLAAAPPPAPPLRALRWLAPTSDAAFALTHRPTECLDAPRGAEMT